MGASKKTTVGYKYFMGIHCVLCRGPIDKLKTIYFADTVAWQGSVTSSQEIEINKPDLFGGENKEGGVSGKVDIMFGEDTQSKNQYLQKKIGNLIPGFRGVVSAVFKSFYFSAMTPYPKQPSFEVKRIPLKTWKPTLAEINGACNPVHAVLEMLTHPEWGMGYTLANCNEAALSYAAQYLYTEGFGLSFCVNSEDDYERIIQMIMTHINGLFFVEPRTGLYTIRLLRGDYIGNIGLLPIFNEYNAEIESFERPSYAELVNEVIVKYRPQSTLKDDTVTVQNLAAIQSQGAVVSQTINYPAIDNANLAAYVASRDLRQKSTPLAVIKIKVNRQAWDLTIGDVFRLSWTAFGIDLLVCRVISMDYGTIEDGMITVSAVEDIFGLPVASYLVNQASKWVDPSSDPKPLDNAKLVETSYWDLVKNLGESAANKLLTDNIGIAGLSAIAASPVGYQSDSYELWTPTGSGMTKVPTETYYPIYDSYVYAEAFVGDTVVKVTQVNLGTFSIMNLQDFFWVGFGTPVTIGDYPNDEVVLVQSIIPNYVTFQTPLTKNHPAGTVVDFGSPPTPAKSYAQASVDMDSSQTLYSGVLTLDTPVFPSYFCIDSEIIKLTNYVVGVGSTIERGVMGSKAVAHKAGRYFRQFWVATPLNNVYERKALSDYPSVATIFSSAVPEVFTTITAFRLSGTKAIRVGSYAEWDDEIVRVDVANAAVIIVARGCLDTVPRNHAANSLMYFSEDYKTLSEYHYVEGETALGKILPRSSKGLLDLAYATELSLALRGRMNLPYPPGNVRINNDAYPVVISGPIYVSWSTRNRLTQTASIIAQNEGNIYPEVGTKYIVGIVGKGSEITSGTDFSWCAPTDTTVTINLESFVPETVGTRNSWQKHEITFERSGWGYNWGKYWGGGGSDGTLLVHCAPSWVYQFQQLAYGSIANRFYNPDGFYLQIKGTNESHGGGSDFNYVARFYNTSNVEVSMATLGYRIAGNICYSYAQLACYLCFNKMPIDSPGISLDSLVRVSLLDASVITKSGTDIISGSEPSDVGPMAIVNDEVWLFAGGKLKRYNPTDLASLGSYSVVSIPIYATGNGSTLYTLDHTTIEAFTTGYASVWSQTLDYNCDGLIFAEGWLWTLTQMNNPTGPGYLVRINPATGLMDTYALNISDLGGGTYIPGYKGYEPFIAICDGFITIAEAANGQAFVIDPRSGSPL